MNNDKLLKYGFYKKSLWKNATLTSFSRSALISTDLEKKWVKKCSTGGQSCIFPKWLLTKSTSTLIILPKCRHYKNTYINKSIRLLFFVILPWSTDIEILWFLKSWFSVDFLSDQYCFCLFDNFRNQLKYWALESLKLFQFFTIWAYVS